MSRQKLTDHSELVSRVLVINTGGTIGMKNSEKGPGQLTPAPGCGLPSASGLNPSPVPS